jgi:hypothetical protein
VAKKKLVQILFLTTFTFTFLGAQAVERERENDDDPPRIFDVEEYDSSWITGDTSGDGSTDYALKLDENGRKRYEAVDFNNDGLMDDFYYYRNEVLIREELDSNFDGRIDLWIFMHDGVRVERYERDTNYDGTADLIRDFGES